MQLKQLTLVGKTTLTTAMMTIVWSLISEMGGDIVSKINHHSENWSVISCELLLEGIAIFLMWLTYYRHPKIWAFADQQWQKKILIGILLWDDLVCLIMVNLCYFRRFQSSIYWQI